MKTSEIAKTIYSSVSLALLVFSIGIVAEDYAMTTFSKRQSRLLQVRSFVIEKKERCHTLAADLDFFDYMFFMALFVLQELIKNVAYDYLKAVVNKVRSWCTRDPPPPQPRVPRPALISQLAPQEFLCGMQHVYFSPLPHRNDQRAHLRNPCQNLQFGRRNSLCVNCADFYAKEIRNQAYVLCEDDHQAKLAEEGRAA